MQVFKNAAEKAVDLVSEFISPSHAELSRSEENRSGGNRSADRPKKKERENPDVDRRPIKKERKEQDQEEKPKEEEKPNEEETPKEVDTVHMKADFIKQLHRQKYIADSYVNTFMPSLRAIEDAAKALCDLPTDDGRDYIVPRSSAQTWRRANKDFNEAHKEYKRVTAINVGLLVPAAGKAAERASELHKANEELTANANEAHEAAVEAANKLKVTQAALHQSSSGHSNIGSSFPLSTEIAEKVKVFGGSDMHTSLILEYMLGEVKSTQELSEAIARLHAFCHATVQSAFADRETQIMGALGSIERTPLVDGFLRRQSHRISTHQSSHE